MLQLNARGCSHRNAILASSHGTYHIQYYIINEAINFLHPYNSLLVKGNETFTSEIGEALTAGSVICLALPLKQFPVHRLIIHISDSFQPDNTTHVSWRFQVRD